MQGYGIVPPTQVRLPAALLRYLPGSRWGKLEHVRYSRWMGD